MKKLFKFIIFLCLCVVVLIQSLIYHSKKNDIDTFENYVLVLGAKANNGKLSKTLINRLDTTVEYLNKHKNAKAILCGGKENNNELSQAEYMQRYLIEKGISKERLIAETNSKNTYENIKFALEKLDKKPSEIMVISSDYHLFRAKLILYRFGILAKTVPAKTPTGAAVPSYARETFAVVIIIAGVFLAIKKVLDWRLPVFYIGTAFVIAFIAGMTHGLSPLHFALVHIGIGGLVFGGIFMLTDPVTSPVDPFGKILFAVGAAFFTMLLRFRSNMPEGVLYSILIMNMLTPMIDKYTVKPTNKDESRKLIMVIAAMLVCSLLIALVWKGA